MSDIIVAPIVETVTVESNKPKDLVIAPTVETVTTEYNKPDSIIVGSATNSVTVQEAYNVVTEQDYLVTIVSGQAGPEGPIGLTGPMGPTGSGGVLGNYGSFYDTTTQTLVSGNVGQPILFNHTLETRNIEIVDGHKIVFNAPGTYSFTFSCQFVNTLNDTVRASVWLHYQGINYPNSASHVDIPARHGNEYGKNLATVNFVATAQGNGDIVEIYWLAENTNVTLATVSGYDGVPVAPSIILTVTQVMYTQVGPAGPIGPAGLSEDSVAYARQIDFVGDDIIYKGEAEAGTLLSSPLWRVRKITLAGDDVSEIWADGNSDFDNIWDNRASLIYS